jgi:hypothetical protein
VTEVCKQCSFFINSKEAKNSYAKAGECRARPPLMINNEQFGIWPLVTSEGWCGEFNGERT